MKNYLTKFQEMIFEIEEHPQIKVIEKLIKIPLTDDEILAIEEDFKIKLDVPIKKFYQEIGELKISWTLSSPLNELDDSILPSGNIHLLPLEQVFAGWNDDEWFNDLWFDWMNNEQKETRKKLKPFDYFDPQDSGCVCFQINNDILNDNLYYHSVDYGINQLKTNFVDYLDMLLLTKGFERWQFLIVSDPNIDGYREYNNHFFAYMKQLFPHTNFNL